MKKININTKTIIASAVILLISFGAMAQPQQRRMQKISPKGSMSQIIPGLSEEQRGQMKEIHLSTMKSMQSLKDEMKVNSAKLNILVKKDDPDMKEITSLVKANSDLQVSMKILSIESKIKSRNILTDEQKIVFDSKAERIRQINGHKRLAMHKQLQGRGRMQGQRNRF